MLDKESIKNELDLEDIKLIVKELGGRFVGTDKDDNLIFTTVCHGGRSHKLYYYLETKSFHCFTDCGDTFDIYELVRRARLQKDAKLGFYDCVKFVAVLTNKIIQCDSIFSTFDKDYLIDDWEWIRKYKQHAKIILPKFTPITSPIMNLFQDVYYHTWIEEGISFATMEKYGIKYYVKEDKIVIPHYDIDGNLIGIRGRALREDDILYGKYMPLKIEGNLYSHSLGANLYGLNFTKEAIKRTKKIMIFEAEKSVMKCEDFYGENNFSVACCSMQLSAFQREIILSLEPDEIFLGYDKQFEDPNSEKAKLFAEKIMKIALQFSAMCKVYVLWDDINLLDYKDSPCDKGKQILQLLMKSKYEIKTKDGISK